jgi:SAM-dependent methyltransferase
MPALEYDEIAKFYDSYVTTECDHAFWLKVCSNAASPCLELMCGTGRITMHLLRNGIDIDGLDVSGELLERFKTKITAEQIATELFHASVVDFSLAKKYGCAFIGFQSISEIVDNEQKVQAFDSIRNHLLPDGEFWLTIHNPVTRKEAMNQSTINIGNFQIDEVGMELHVSAVFNLDEPSGIVTGEQYFEIRREGKEVQRNTLPVRFHLIGPEETRVLLHRAGFEIVRELGSYEEEDFDADSSPFYIAKCMARR